MIDSPSFAPSAIAAAILDAVAHRGPGKSVCPSEVARALAENATGARGAGHGEAEEAEWRALMPAVRREAATLVAAGRVRATQRGRPVDPVTARGPIRLALPEDAR